MKMTLFEEQGFFQDKTGKAISKGKCFENCFEPEYHCSYITRNDTRIHTPSQTIHARRRT